MSGDEDPTTNVKEELEYCDDDKKLSSEVCPTGIALKEGIIEQGSPLKKEFNITPLGPQYM